MGHSCSHGIEKNTAAAEESGDSRRVLDLRACGIPRKAGGGLPDTHALND